MTNNAEIPIDYMHPDVPGELPWIDIPVIDVSNDNLEVFGFLVDDYQDCSIEIVQWPAQGWRPVDADTGDEGGTTSGHFNAWWSGQTLYGQNDAVSGEYVLGWSENPGLASDAGNDSPERVLLWHTAVRLKSNDIYFSRSHRVWWFGGLVNKGSNNSNIGLQLIRLALTNRAILCNDKVLYPAN